MWPRSERHRLARYSSYLKWLGLAWSVALRGLVLLERLEQGKAEGRLGRGTSSWYRGTKGSSFKDAGEWLWVGECIESGVAPSKETRGIDMVFIPFQISGLWPESHYKMQLEYRTIPSPAPSNHHYQRPHHHHCHHGTVKDVPLPNSDQTL